MLKRKDFNDCTEYRYFIENEASPNLSPEDEILLARREKCCYTESTLEIVRSPSFLFRGLMQIPSGLKWFLVIFVIICLRFVAAKGWIHSGSPTTRAVAKVLNDIARIEKDFTRRTDAVNFEEVHQLRRFSQQIDEFRGKIKTVDLSPCPDDFRAATQRYVNTLDAVAVIFNEIIQTAITAHGTNAEHRKRELEDRSEALTLQLERIGKQCAAAGMKVNEIAKSHGVKVFNLVPPGFDATELRYTSVNEFSTTAYTPYQLDSPSVPSSPSPQTSSIPNRPTIPKAAASVPTSTTTPPVSKIAGTQHELTPYMQPVYDGAYKRIGKLVKMTQDSHAAEDLKAAAEKTWEYAAHYRDSEFPRTFLDPLKKLEDCMNDFIKTQNDMQTASENPFADKDDLKRMETRQIREIKQVLRNLNATAERYGCQTATLP